jgi:hypothetical protein
MTDDKMFYIPKATNPKYLAGKKYMERDKSKDWKPIFIPKQKEN